MNDNTEHPDYKALYESEVRFREYYQYICQGLKSYYEMLLIDAILTPRAQEYRDWADRLINGPRPSEEPPLNEPEAHD